LNGGRSRRGVDAILKSGDYLANQVHLGAEVGGLVSRKRVDAKMSQPKRVLDRRQTTKYDVGPCEVDLEPRAHSGVLRRQFGGEADQSVHLRLFIQTRARLLDCIDCLQCIARQNQVIDSLTEHLMF
jgi:hypothetical protein